jgi:hypothetical protein
MASYRAIPLVSRSWWVENSFSINHDYTSQCLFVTADYWSEATKLRYDNLSSDSVKFTDTNTIFNDANAMAAFTTCTGVILPSWDNTACSSDEFDAACFAD